MNITEICRTMIPGYDPWDDPGDSKFYPEYAQNAVDFFEEYLIHTAGHMAGQPFALMDWQKAIVGNLFGWYRESGYRRYKKCFVYVPRKNGKTTMVAGIATYMFICEQEPGGQTYAAASEGDQATILFEMAMSMIDKNEELKEGVKFIPSQKIMKNEYGKFKAITAKGLSKHGLNPSFFVVDEVHAQRDNVLIEALTTGTKARKQPLEFYISTADTAGESPCNDMLEIARLIRDGDILQTNYLPVIYETLPSEDWKSIDVAIRCNPSIGQSFDLEVLRDDLEEAKQSAKKEVSYKRLTLNMVVSGESIWLDMDKWNNCKIEMDISDLKGAKCYAGLDMATKKDIVALVLLFPDFNNLLLPFFWLPETCLEDGPNADKYKAWHAAGHVVTTSGNITDYKYVRDSIQGLAKLYEIMEIAYDPYNATHLCNQLGDDGFNVVEFTQTLRNFNEPSKEFEAWMLSGQLAHLDNPILNWMAAHVQIYTDNNENMRPIKKKNTHAKIDGIVAAVMAVARVMWHKEQPTPYVGTRLYTL